MLRHDPGNEVAGGIGVGRVVRDRDDLAVAEALRYSPGARGCDDRHALLGKPYDDGSADAA
ncbi:hypothetical protein LP418_27580 [Nocardioides sp. B-3]|nr:hypothetical protein [Nocardioides sp. B-3]UUZ59493.1 hypothetical protein LP418_27580 [Nocardioides sp. B-3]